MKKQGGFTVIELLIVIVTSGIMFTLMFSFFWQYWQYSERAQSDLDVFTARLDIGDYIRESVGTSAGLITQNSIADPNANLPDPIAGSNYWLMIHSVPGTMTASTTDDQPLLYFKRFSQTPSKALIFNGLVPYEDEYVIYLNNNRELRVRTLANPDATGSQLKTTCPPSIATSACPEDKLLISDVQSVVSRYFSRSGNLLDYTPVWDPDISDYVNGPDFPAVEVVEYTVNVEKKAFTQTANTTKSSTIIRIALRNA